MSNEHKPPSARSGISNLPHPARTAHRPWRLCRADPFLLFLKMDTERSSLLAEPSVIPDEYRWKQPRGQLIGKGRNDPATLEMRKK